MRAWCMLCNRKKTKPRPTHIYVDARGVEDRLEVQHGAGQLVESRANDLELVRVGAVDLHLRRRDGGVLIDGGDLTAGLGGGGAERHPAVPGVGGQQHEGSGESAGVLLVRVFSVGRACASDDKDESFSTMFGK